MAVATLVRELAGDYAVQAEDKGLQIVIEGNGVVFADREMLKKIIDNLLSNAVWYTPKGQQINAEIYTSRLHSSFLPPEEAPPR